MAVIVQDGRLTLTGYVGEHWAYGDEIIVDGFTQPMVLAALAEIGDDTDLTVHINSGGGFVDTGEGIRASLAARPGRTDVVIEGIAASAASLIAMAGETISMSEGSRMMIHDPANVTFGTVADHEATIRQLTSAASAMARVYARRSGIEPNAAREIMKAETWYVAEEAVEAGFADAVLGNKGRPVAAFPYQQYAHAPQQLVALAKENGWRLPAARPAASVASKAASSAAEPRHQEEIPMTDKERADQLAAELKSLKAQIDSGKSADETAALQEELKALREEKEARENADAIMSLEEAKGREAQAKALADAGVKADAAKAILAAAPEPKAEEGATTYEASRINGAGLGGKPKASTKGDRSVLTAAVERTNKRAAR